MRAWLAGVLLLLAGGATPAAAQDRSGDFDFYVLSLSWSPTYCETSDRPDRNQCDGSKNFGFVMHGLWPQYERGFPSQCQVSGRNPTRAQVDDMLDIMPSPGLVRHEWREHGTCSGLDPRSYFALARKAAESVTVPDQYKNADKDADVTTADVERAFVAANRQLQPSMMAVQCNRGMLTEVRICMTKDLKFRPCGDVDRRGCRTDRLQMPGIGGR